MTPWETQEVTPKPVVKINGQQAEVEASDNFATVVKAMAAAKGLSKYTVIADGAEIHESNAPSTFAGLRVVEIKKYDEAA